MASTKLTSSVRTTWIQEILDYVDLNEEFAKVQRGIQAHRHTETDTDTDALNTGNALQIDGANEILNGTVKLNQTVGSMSDGELAGALNARIQNVSDTGVADTEFTVAHGLGRIPVGFWCVRNNKAGVVYDSGGTWTSTNILLKCNVANCNVWLFIF